MNGRWLFVLGSAGALAGVRRGTADGRAGATGAHARRGPDLEVDAFRSYTLAFVDGAEMARVFVVHRTIGAFRAGFEYWYVNRRSLGALGRSALRISSRDHIHVAPTPPSYAHEQTFFLATTSSWGTGWTSDPYSFGTLYGGMDATGKGDLYLRLGKSPGALPVLSHVVWYQVLSAGGPDNVTPEGTFSIRTTQTVPSIDLGYVVHPS